MSTTTSMAAALAAFTPSESFNDLLRRTLYPPFQFHYVSDYQQKCQSFAFGNMYELQVTNNRSATILVYDLIHKFLECKPNAFVIHLSTCNNFSLSLIQSGLDVDKLNPLLLAANAQGRFKSVTVLHLQQLLATLELLSLSLDGAPCLVVMEYLIPLFLTCKTDTHTAATRSLAAEVLHSLARLTESQHVIIIALTQKSNPKTTGTMMREGNPKDPLTQLWKEKFKRFIYISDI